MKTILLTSIITLYSFLSFGGERIDLDNPSFIYKETIKMNLKKKTSNSHNTFHINEGAALMMGGVAFMACGLFTPQEQHWSGDKSWHEDPTSGSFVDTPIYMQPSRLLPLLTGVVLFVPGVAITIGN